VRAARIRELGRPPEPEDVDAPSPSEGGALVEVEAVALNPLDFAVGNGRFYGGHPPLPYVPGCEAVGRLDGGRVYVSGGGLGVTRDGTIAERVAVGADATMPLPDDVEPALAVACGIAGLAGWIPVTRIAEVGPDDRVLVLGATGSVGSFAVQAARFRGAARVVAAGRSRERLERARELGADAVVELGGDDDARAIDGAFAGEGPTVVIDPLWGPPLEAAVAAAAPRARIVSLGQSAGGEARLPSAAVRGKQLRIEGYTTFAVPAEVQREAYLELVAEAHAGRVHVDLETHPLEAVGEAWAHLAEGTGAKIVVLV
jgi:NADPH:quinone reductase-like Zn-dependent oxidoreductase